MKESQLKRLLRLLREAPSTVKECAALMGVSSRAAHVGVWQLTSTGKVAIVGAVPNPDSGRGFKKTLKLYGSQSDADAGG